MKKVVGPIAIGFWLLAAVVLLQGTGRQTAQRRRHNAASPGAPTQQAVNDPVLVGYWHNFVNGAGFIQLKDVSPQFDVVNIAFATPVSGSTSTIEFKLISLESESQFISDVALLRGIGKKIVLSIGGANALVKLNTSSDLANFVSSVSSLVSKFEFDGIDVDFEAGSVELNPGDNDFKNPTTPAIANLITALHQLKSAFGPNFIVSMAPGTFEVQAGFKNYGGGSGAYLPLIFGTRDIISYVYVQDYNSGTRLALDGKIYADGTADFHVAMTEMLLQGFPVGGNASNVFPALQPGQVSFGVPAYTNAQGFTSNSDLLNALSYLMNGVSFGGQYQLWNAAGYPGMRGLMTWSINWDAFYGFSLSNAVGPFLHGVGGTGPVINSATAAHKNLLVIGSRFDSGAVIIVDGQDQQTSNDDASPSTKLVGIKTIKRAKIGPGDSVTVQVRNQSGSLSNQVQYTRPNG